jgi:hypothetical protein
VINHLDLIRNRSRTLACIATAGAAAALLAACGATTGPGSLSLPTLPGSGGSGPTATPESTPTATPAATPTASPSATASTDSTGHLGDTLTISGPTVDTVQVTLVKVFDPATGTDESPPDGTRWVGFELTLSTPDGTASAESQAVDVIGSDGKTYGLNTSYHLDAMDGCRAVTNDTQGQLNTFCTGVGVPPGVTVAQVGYSETGVDIGAAAQVFWTVP